MFDKNFYELCKVSYVTSDKPTIIDAIHRYLNMFPQLIPLSTSVRDRKLAKALEENNFTLLQSNYFTTVELKYAWDKAYFIVLDNNSQKKTVLIQSGEKFSRISTRYAIQTIRHIHKLIVKDVFHQSFYPCSMEALCLPEVLRPNHFRRLPDFFLLMVQCNMVSEICIIQLFFHLQLIRNHLFLLKMSDDFLR